MKIDHEYFLKEFHAFRKIMCSTEYSPEQKYDAWEGLLRVYFFCEGGDVEVREQAIRMLMAEFPLRMSLELVSKLEALFHERI
jgi:hypothetical protein